MQIQQSLKLARAQKSHWLSELGQWAQMPCQAVEAIDDVNLAHETNSLKSPILDCSVSYQKAAVKAALKDSNQDPQEEAMCVAARNQNDRASFQSMEWMDRKDRAKLSEKAVKWHQPDAGNAEIWTYTFMYRR